MQQPKKKSLAELIAEKKAAAAARISESLTVPTSAPVISEVIEKLEQHKQEQEEAEVYETIAETFSLDIKLNPEQEMAKELAFAGKSFCLIGAAGTGKTTAQREIAAALLQSKALETHVFRIQGSGGERVSAPSIAFVAYTRIASGNLRRAIHKNKDLEAALEHNITTIHNLLEYEPETYYDYEEQREKFRFVPRRTASNKLDITHLGIEESSQVDLDLWYKLFSAMREGTQVIFIGDINQLPPVFGASILNYALVQLPVIELKHVYRQKEGSSILDNAHKILAGDHNLIEDEHFKIIEGGDKQFSQSKLALALSGSLAKWFLAGEYDPEQDIVLSPFNVQDLGTDSMNRYIAQFLGEKRQAIVHEVICGIQKIYLAEGDKVYFNKQVGYITKIVRNGEYIGKTPKQASANLTRFGTYKGSITEEEDDLELAGYEDISLEEIAAQAEVPAAKRKASHRVSVMLETGLEVTLDTVGAFSSQSFSLGYALTVHKAQGCEWRKVFFILHKDHSIMAFRELFYTAVTRARENLIIIAKKTMIQKAIRTQRIKGNTLAEKIAFFNAGLMNQDDVRCVK